MNESTTRFADHLRRALALPIDVNRDHRRFAPELAYGRHSGPPALHAKQGAVLVLLFPDHDDWYVVLTERHSGLPSHAGQVSFPGGRIEPGETASQAAFREYEEEVGPLDVQEFIGELPPTYIYASDYLVTSCVAIAPERPMFRPNPQEVTDVLVPSLAQLAEPKRRGEHTVVRGPLRFNVPHCAILGKRVWGATWIILGDLLRRLDAIGPIA